MSADDIAISVRNLTKTYRLFGHPGDRIKQFFSFGLKQYHREFTALQDVSFDIKKGETVGIIGRNGSGKSTLLQLICGIIKPTAGTVKVGGRISALLELGAGFNPEFTGRENAYFQGALMGFTKAQMDKRFGEIAAFADIGEFIDQPVRTYSSGMFVRLAFAVIAHVDADILLIDEALSVGDAQFTRKCMRFLQKFKQTGTLLVVSHDISSIVSICDRVVWLDRGSVHLNDNTKSVCDAYLMAMFEVSGPVKVSYPDSPKAETMLDQRRNFLNASNLRNDLAVLNFYLPVEAKGQGKARIVEACITDSDGHPYEWIVGGEIVTLRILAQTAAPVELPILGFTVQDWAGRSMFGDNTYLSFIDQFPQVPAGCNLEARFTFVMPRLPVGQYSLCAAMAEGTQSQHIMLDWRPDCVLIQSRASSTTGDLGLPMINIVLEATSNMETKFATN
jgi:lipopolysaccharide transport system ATP-binding protein